MPADNIETEKGQSLSGQRLSRVTKTIYGVGQIAESVKTIIFGLFMLFFYTTVMGLPASLVGVIAAVGLVWDAVIDPFIGYVSDVSRSKFGRRHLYMFFGMILMGVSFWALFSPPRELSTGALAAWLLVTSLMVRTSTSLFTIPYLALGAELTQDYHERNTVSGIRGAWALLGALAAAVLSLALFFPDDGSGIDRKFNYSGYPAMGLAFGVVMTIAASTAILGTLGWRQKAREPSVVSSGVKSAGSFFVGIVTALKNPSFRAIFISMSLFFLAVVVNSILTIYYLTYYVQVTDSKTQGLLQGVLWGTGLIGVVFWLRIAKVVEKRWLYFIATMVTALGMAGAVLLFGEGRPLGVANVRALYLGYAFVGFFASILWVIPPSMIADVADEDELDTGERREGAFYGIFNFGQQLAAGMSVLITGVFVDWYAGLAAGEELQSELTVERIAVLYGFLPAGFLVIAAFVILRYSLDQRKVEAIQRKLASRPFDRAP